MKPNRKKKTAIVAPGLYPCAVGGAEVFNESLIRSLSADCDVKYITECSEVIEGAEKSLLPKARPLNQMFAVFLRLIVMERERIVVTSFMRTKWYYVIIYPILNSLFGKKYLIIIHGGGLSRWRFRAPYVWYFKRAKRVFGVSDRICEEYHARSGVDVAYLPPMVPINVLECSKSEARKRHGLNEKDVVFLWVGSLKKLKNPMTLLRAVYALGSDFLIENAVKILFAGDGHLRSEMEDFICDNNLSGFIHLLGNVPRADIPELYRLSDNYIIASDYEGTPISMLEAMANGLLVIGSDVPGINTVISHGESGFLFDRGDIEGLAKLIRTASLTTDSSVKEGGKNLFITNFSYERTLLKIKAVL